MNEATDNYDTESILHLIAQVTVHTTRPAYRRSKRGIAAPYHHPARCEDRLKTQADLNLWQQQNVSLQSEIHGEHKFEDMVGKAPVMQNIFAIVRNVAQMDATVLINGETGTGKEIITRALHSLSSRRMIFSLR